MKRTKLLGAEIVMICACAACNITANGNSVTTLQPSNNGGQQPQAMSSIQAYFTCAGRQGCDSEEIINNLLDSINQAQSSIDMAMYNLNLTEIANALIKAEKRGVKVRLVTDSSNLDGEAMRRISEAGIMIVSRDDGNGIMHDKFVVIDGREVWAGSLNLTWNGVNEDNNNFVRIDSDKAAADYAIEFDEMYTQKRFGPDSTSDTPYPTMILDGIPVEIYFAPEDHVQSKIIELVGHAKTSVDFLSLTFTLDNLSSALIAAEKRGVKVRGVFEEQNALTDSGSDYYMMRKAGLDVLLDGNSGLMHHKVMIIDHEIVVFGSYNFTSSADRRNDENLVIVTSANLAEQYETEFRRIYSIAKP